jgi:hypothetical protein
LANQVLEFFVCLQNKINLKQASRAPARPMDRISILKVLGVLKNRSHKKDKCQENNRDERAQHRYFTPIRKIAFFPREERKD